MSARESHERAHGPYAHGRKWRVILIGADGSRSVVSYASEVLARKVVDEAKRQAQGRTVDQAVSAYLDAMRDTVRESTLVTMGYRLRAFLRIPSEDTALAYLDVKRAKELYALRVAETRTDTHRNELSTVQRAAAWWVKQGWRMDNPFSSVEPTGRRHRGKPTLRIDESRDFVFTALEEESISGLACATTFLLGLRASECTDRIVRDVDNGGAILWITEAKTEAGVRPMVIPEMLRARILALTVGKRSTDRLFGDVDRHWLAYHTKRICRVAGLKEVPPHGLRGLHSTMAVARMSPEAVAASLGQTNANVTRRHYFAPGAEANANNGRVIDLMLGNGTGSRVPNVDATPPGPEVRAENDSCAKGDSNPHGVTH